MLSSKVKKNNFSRVKLNIFHLHSENILCAVASIP